MHNGLLEYIVEDLKSQSSDLLLIENNDQFFFREDVFKYLKDAGFIIGTGSQLKQRILFELKPKDSVLILLSKDRVSCLEDIETKGKRVEVFLDKYIQGYHIPTIISEPIPVLDKLFQITQFVNLGKTETKKFLKELKKDIRSGAENALDLEKLTNEVNQELLNSGVNINWTGVSLNIGRLISTTIGSELYSKTQEIVKNANDKFQEYRDVRYNGTKKSSATKRPQNVCKILDFLDFNCKEDKLALIVVDGMSIWQYILLSEGIKASKIENTTLSWLPSITQLSRQAIFRGGEPDYNYSQGPRNEDKLWMDFWTKKGFSSHQVRYMHSKIDLSSIGLVDRLAIVYKELDAKMHGNCDDYVDLKDLTLNWIDRSGVLNTISELLEKKYRIFITTDHGNIEAEGWRGLTSREKLGQKHKSGSRGERHLEYSEQWLYDEFLDNNEEILNSIVKEDQALYFKNNQSFSRKERLVTHGGAHLLEVVIPFVEVNNG